MVNDAPTAGAEAEPSISKYAVHTRSTEYPNSNDRSHVAVMTRPPPAYVRWRSSAPPRAEHEPLVRVAEARPDDRDARSSLRLLEGDAHVPPVVTLDLRPAERCVALDRREVDLHSAAGLVGVVGVHGCELGLGVGEC